ncbi:trans-resveratrol di-O-methyltransferase-like [Chenopodium quinoa]|uniref:trans-resveratrol di-O-methyltransferase-like n=1 Tax=Chenopodium quinoa TaxID=63459 RepID=UPI000B77CA1E|nr:trans-resveratrol di-O-methyltransferase-like [Chenopodium quinoa]
MDQANIYPEEEAKEQLLDAQAHIWRHVFYFLKSMALKCAIQLGIPDTIHKHGKPMTLKELANSLPIIPNKATSLSRLMRLLVSSKFFSMKTLANGEEGFALNLSYQLLLKDHPLSQAPFVIGILDPRLVGPSHYLSSWFESEAESSFHIAYGKSVWEFAGHDLEFNDIFNQAMESDSRFATSLLVTNNVFKGLFEGVESLMDVGGGSGATAKAISEAIPWLKCSVLDLPQVVGRVQKDGCNLNFVAGDMFEAIPPADTVLLKWILHDWSDIDCIKILQKCKEAIPTKKQGGKVIIIDIVVDPQMNKNKNSDVQLLLDMEMMFVTGGGKERTKQEWENIFIIAGFSDFIILPILGLRSAIVVYPS